MSTVTPARPVQARPAPPRPRIPVAGGRAAGIDPLRVLRRHVLGLMVSCLMGGALGVGAYLVLNRVYPLYTGQVIFEVKPGVSEAGDVSTQEQLKDDDVFRVANTQLVLMLSREVLTNAMSTADVQDKTTWFRKDFVEDEKPLVAEAVDELIDDLRTSVIRGTELFQVRWSTHDPRDVPIVLNSIARAYMSKRQALDNEIHNNNLKLFQSQLRDTNLQIMDLDQEIQAFIVDHKITSLTDPRYHETALAIEEMVGQIAEATRAFSIARSSFLQVAAKLEGTMEPTPEDVVEAENDFAVVPVVRAVESLKYELRIAREKFKGRHPRIEEAQAALEAAEAEKKAKIDEVIRRNLNARLKTHSDEMERFQRMLEELEVENEKKSEQLSELAAQQSQYEALRSQREHLEAARDNDRQLIKEIQLMRLRTDAQRVGIAEDAVTPRELSFPKPEIIIPLGVLAVLALTLGGIFLREITDHRIKSASDVAVLPGARVLGVIPDLEDDPTKCQTAELVLQRYPSSVVAESYRQVCTPLSKAIDLAGHQTLVLIGGLPGAGTTTAATNIAWSLAATGHNVLLVDANFRRPRLAEVMGQANDQPGLGDVLAGDITVEGAAVPAERGIHVLGAGTPANRVIDRLNTERFDSAVAEMRSRFDVIIFDAPPAVVAGEPLVLANKLDAAVLVVRAFQEERGLVARLIHQLADARAELIGIVLNRPRGTAGGYFKKNFATMAQYANAGRGGAGPRNG